MSGQIHDAGSITSFTPVPDGGRVVDEHGEHIGYLAGYGVFVTERSNWVIKTVVVPMVLSDGMVLAMVSGWRLEAHREAA